MDISQFKYHSTDTEPMTSKENLISRFSLEDNAPLKFGLIDIRLSKNPLPLCHILHFKEGDCEKIALFTKTSSGELVFIDTIHSQMDFMAFDDPLVQMKLCFNKLKKLMTGTKCVKFKRVSFLETYF